MFKIRTKIGYCFFKVSPSHGIGLLYSEDIVFEICKILAINKCLGLVRIFTLLISKVEIFYLSITCRTLYNCLNSKEKKKVLLKIIDNTLPEISPITQFRKKKLLSSLENKSLVGTMEMGLNAHYATYSNTCIASIDFLHFLTVS